MYLIVVIGKFLAPFSANEAAVSGSSHSFDVAHGLLVLSLCNG
jgi:hypothetical protein